MNYETLNQVQGDKTVVATQSPGGRELRGGGRLDFHPLLLATAS